MQCNWCGRTYTNGYGGGYCSRRCYEEGHRRTCKGCGSSFTGRGYSGSGIYSGGGGDWCSEACYRRNASPAQKKADAATAKLVWTMILFILCPPLLFLLYWKQTLAVIKVLFRMVFSRFFWKYVVPIGIVVAAVIMYIAHRDRVKACEAEMSQYFESANAELQETLWAIAKDRIAALEAMERQRAEDARKRDEEAARQKAELDAAIEAAKAEQNREMEVGNVNAFAKAHFPEQFRKQQILDAEIHDFETRLNRYKAENKKGSDDLEYDEAYVKLLLRRNKSILERRTIGQKISAEYQMYQTKGARE